MLLEKIQKQFVFPHESLPMFIASILGAGLGFAVRSLIPTEANKIFGIVGEIYFNVLKALMLFYMFTKIVYNTLKISKIKNSFCIIATTILFFFLSSLIFSILGYFTMNFFLKFVPVLSDSEIAQVSAHKEESGDITSSIKQIAFMAIPKNYIQSAKDSNILAITFFSLILGVFLAKNLSKRKIGQNGIDCRKLFKIADATFEKIADFILSFTALGIFSIIFSQIAAIEDLTVFKNLGILAASFSLLCFAACVLIYPMFFCCLVNSNKRSKLIGPYRDLFIKAFSTSAGLTTLTDNTRIAKDIGVPESIAGVLMPIALILQINGSTVYNTMVITFIAHIYKIDFSINNRIALVIISVIISISSPPIPYGTILVLFYVGQIVEVYVPLKIISLLIMVDIYFDRVVTLWNIWPNAITLLFVSTYCKGNANNEDTDLTKISSDNESDSNEEEEYYI
ncbi:hypothetical protein MHBO_000429 [Bonamia ostreae]|uniref:Amino acid transporter n=1 Tax=Bonamia ostreae TaxID=126728 RepID=A0ABV2AG87_9EUKA